MHLCVRCRNKSDSVPDIVEVERITPEIISETADLITYRKVKMNIADELKAQMKEMKTIYKYVYYCGKLKAITVGSDVGSQQRKECEYFAE